MIKLPLTIINTHFIFFDKTVKICSIILKTKQATFVYTKWDAWTSHGVIEDHVIAAKIDFLNNSSGIDLSA